jgi:hypothetical protein
MRMVFAQVTKPTFVNNFLWHEGAIVSVDLDKLGVASLGVNTPGLIATVATKESTPASYSDGLLFQGRPEFGFHS